jgi:hypothetical protein
MIIIPTHNMTASPIVICSICTNRSISIAIKLFGGINPVIKIDLVQLHVNIDYPMKVIERFIEPLKTTFRFIVGQNAKDNFDIIDDADQNDYWFHVYNESSCHVICDLSTQTITLDKKELRYVLKQGAIICKENFSKHKSNRDLTIVYTQIKNVVKTKVVGMVSLSESKTIRV